MREVKDRDGSRDGWLLMVREGLVMALWFGSLLGLVVLGYGMAG